MTTTKPFTIIGESLSDGYSSKYKPEDLVRASWCYLHGELESLNGYDIFSLLKQELTSEQNDRGVITNQFSEGIYSCLFEDKECTFFRWENDTTKYCGLVVLNTDKKSYRYAERQFNLKSSCI